MKIQPQLGRKVARRVLAWTIAITPLVNMTPAWAEKPDPPITSQALWSLWWGDFDALEKQNAELRQPGHIAADGGSELAEFRTGIERILDSKLPHSEPYLRELEALTLQWATEHPKSALAHILHAQALLKHAWSYRGNGYAKEVPPEAWNDFLSYSRRAVDYLKAHADVALTDSYAHSTLLQIGMGLGWNARQLEAIAQDGLKRNPQDISLYFDIVTSLLPKWGGDVKTLDKYIRQVAQQTQADLGTGMYARLYSSAAEQQFGHALFEDSRADWPTMKKSWEDFLSRYPESPERRNRYAYMACLAKDKATLIAQLEQLGPKIDASQWGPNPERSLESCQRLAKQL